jgi:hypothetical protein
VSYVDISDQTKLLPLKPSLWFNYPPYPLPCVIKYTVFTYTVCKGDGYEVRRGGGLRQINTCRKVSLQANFLRCRYFALVST